MKKKKSNFLNNLLDFLFTIKHFDLSIILKILMLFFLIPIIIAAAFSINSGILKNEVSGGEYVIILFLILLLLCKTVEYFLSLEIPIQYALVMLTISIILSAKYNISFIHKISEAYLILIITNFIMVKYNLYKLLLKKRKYK